MVGYTTIPDTDIDPDSPLTTGLLTLLRDNPIAAMEGATGATRLERAAIRDTVAGSSYTVAVNTAGSTIGATTFTKGMEIKIPFSGGLEVEFSMSISAASSGTVEGVIYVNGVSVGTVRSTSINTFTQYTENITGLVAGDLIQIYGRKVSGTTACVLDNQYLREDSAITYPVD